MTMKMDLSINSDTRGELLIIGASVSWSIMTCPLIGFMSTYSMSNFHNIMTHLASLPVRVALLSRYFNELILATSFVF